MKYFKKSKFSDNFNNKVGIVILHRKCFLERFDQFSMLKNDFENQNFAILKEVVHKFGKSDIIKKMLNSTRCVCGFMPNSHKKSMTMSNFHALIPHPGEIL